jgi:hypothetical protein
LLANAGCGGANTQQALLDALGINGPEGTARAQSQFSAGPGYQFAFDQAQKAAIGGANAAGMAPSGNTLDALTRLGTNYGNQAWQQYLDNLNRQLGLQAQVGTSAAAGKAGAQLTGGTGAANLYGATGSKLADLLSGTGVNAAGITWGGEELADLAMQATAQVKRVLCCTRGPRAGRRDQQTLDLLKGTFAPYRQPSRRERRRDTGPLNLLFNE